MMPTEGFLAFSLEPTERFYLPAEEPVRIW